MESVDASSTSPPIGISVQGLEQLRRDNARAPWLEYPPLTISMASPKSKHSPPGAMAGSLIALGAALISVFGQ
jgi:hypothetical protein